MKILKITLWVLAGMAVVFVGNGIYRFSRPQVEATSRPLTLAEFRDQYGHEALPQSASNIWYAHSSVGLGGRASLYRFNAPAADCVAYAKQIMSKGGVDRQTGKATPLLLVELKVSPDAIQHKFLKEAYGLDTAGWFDVECIKEGWEGRCSPSGLGHLWVDGKRGRFYYYWTD